MQRQNLLKKPKFIDLSESSSTSRSFTFNHPSLNNPKQKIINIHYQDVSQFRHLKYVNSLKIHNSEINNFLGNRNKNILFLFGPSGCGKRLLLQSTLQNSRIPYQYAQPRIWQKEDGSLLYQDIYQMIESNFKDSNILWQKVVIFTQFPILLADSGSEQTKKYTAFRSQLYDLFFNCPPSNKYIFILNNQIYNSFYILNQNSQNSSLNKLANLSILRMQAYGIRQMKSIIEHFTIKFPEYVNISNSKQMMNEIVTQANGDARKALNLIYHKKMQEVPLKKRFRSIGKVKKPANELKEQKKLSVFHMLGKFLYGKRYNLRYNPKSNNKQQRQISAYYTQEELKRQDPKFYFSPVQVFDRSRMPLSTFTELLHQNYLKRYGKVLDIRNMSNIFRYYDSYLHNSLNHYQLLRQLQSITKELVTWGILIYNKNTVRDHRMFQIQKSKNRVIQQLISKKKSILYNFYTRNQQSYRYRIQDVLSFAIYTKIPEYKLEYGFFHQKLIELISDSRRYFKHSQLTSYQNTFEQEDLTNNILQKLNNITQAITKQLDQREKKSKNYAMLLQDSDQSDIDSDIQ